MDRKNCTHAGLDPAVCIITWCARCSGWRFSRLGVQPGSASASSSLEVYESHFLPSEDTSPDDTWSLFMRAFNVAREYVETGQVELPQYEANNLERWVVRSTHDS